MRRSLKWLESRSFQKVELIMEDLFVLENEFFETFFADGKLYERKFIFAPGSISEKNSDLLPVMEENSVLAE